MRLGALPVELYNLIGETTSTGSLLVCILGARAVLYTHLNEIKEMAIEVKNEQLYSLARTIINELIDDVFDVDVADDDDDDSSKRRQSSLTSLYVV